MKILHSGFNRRAVTLGVAAVVLAGAGGLTLALSTLAEAAVTSGTTYTVVNAGSGKCVDSRSAATANGTAVQQYSCNSTAAQQWTFTATSGGYYQVGGSGSPAQVWDVTNVSTADSALVQLWLYGGGTNQQWQAVLEPGGYWHFVNMSSQKCLTASGSGDGTQLTQVTCTGIASQSFKLQQQP